MDNSYGDGNVYRGQVCKDPETVTIEINKYDADVERLVEAAKEVVRISDRKHDAWDELKTALDPFNK